MLTAWKNLRIQPIPSIEMTQEMSVHLYKVVEQTRVERLGEGIARADRLLTVERDVNLFLGLPPSCVHHTTRQLRPHVLRIDAQQIRRKLKR